MKKLRIIVFALIFMASCSLPSFQDVPISGEFAIPLINAKVTIGSLLEGQENFSLEVGPEGLLVLQYSTQLLSESISEILPSIASIGEVEIIDTISTFPLTTSDNFIISKAILSGDEMRFRFSHDKEESVSINLKIPELTKDGEIFEFDFVLNAQGSLPYSEFTTSFDLDGFLFESDNNELSFIYDARNPTDERIKLVFAAMSFNELRFSYGEGSYERTSYELQGDSLSLDVLNGWKSGSLEFEDPRINFNISHSYGFPIALKINEIEINTSENDTKILDAESVGEEVALEFPGFSNVSEVLTTTISFTKDNSNINTLFNEKVKFVDYDIDAIINPEGDLDILGFATDESFFNVDAEMELPLSLKLNDFALQDTIDLETLFPDEILEGELKVVSNNSYPLSMNAYFIFLDENDQVLERLLENDPLVIEPAQEKTRLINLNTEVINKIRSTKRIVVVSQFNSQAGDSDFARLLSDQSLELRVGLKFKI